MARYWQDTGKYFKNIITNRKAELETTLHLKQTIPTQAFTSMPALFPPPGSPFLGGGAVTWGSHTASVSPLLRALELCGQVDFCLA